MAYQHDLIREIPDTALAGRFDGEPLVQSFSVALPRGRTGRVWITTAEALEVPGFGRPWVAARLTELRQERGARALNRALAEGLRLHASTATALSLAA